MIQASKPLSALVLSCTLLAAPVAAEDDSSSLMERGAEMFLDGLMAEMEPLFQEMEPLLDEWNEDMAAFVAAFLDQVDDWTMYHLPETLPNGDIIMRRKLPDEIEQPDETTESVEIDL